MGTQGIVTILNRKGESFIKIIAGCDGDQAKPLSEAIKSQLWEEQNDIDPMDVEDLCENLHFGCKDCLVIMKNGEFTDKCMEEEIQGYENGTYERYLETFKDPKFNPRWEQGTAAYTEVVRIY